MVMVRIIRIWVRVKVSVNRVTVTVRFWYMVKSRVSVRLVLVVIG